MLLFVLPASAIGLGLGTFWFVYGIWPRSWWMFLLFGCLAYAHSELCKFVVKRVVAEYEAAYDK